jgi:hypothetical protein
MDQDTHKVVLSEKPIHVEQALDLEGLSRKGVFFPPCFHPLSSGSQGWISFLPQCFPTRLQRSHPNLWKNKTLW